MQNAGPTILQRRIVIGAVLCMAAYAIVALRLADVTLFASPAGAQRPAMPGYARADLVDRNGALLARDMRVYDLYALPSAFPDPHKKQADRDVSLPAEERAAAAALSPILQVSADYLVRKFHDSKGNDRKGYVLLARQLPPELRDRVASLHRRGLEFQAVSKRNYPLGRMGAQVIGVADKEGKGVSGLEHGLDARLHAGAPGAKVETSLDTQVQFVLAHEAEVSKEKFGAKAAGALVMDVRTGEILGMVSLPDFDPNDRVALNADPYTNSVRNVMAQDVYELGSVFKVFSFALGLEDHTFRPDEVFPIGKGYELCGHTIHEAEKMPAQLAARDILARSSNIGTTQIALRSGGARQKAFLAHMGLLQGLKTELPESARPHYPRTWGPMETATISFGHGIAVTPLAYAAAAAAIVNGGRKVTPTFLKHPEDGRGEQLIRPETSAQMRALLRYVVTDGSGKKANVPGYDVGGKTGSAEKLEHGVYVSKLVTSFLAVFPISSPRYLVFVMLDEPHGTPETGGFALAGYTAAPMAGQIITRIAPMLNVPLSPAAVAEPVPTKEKS